MRQESGAGNEVGLVPPMPDSVRLGAHIREKIVEEKQEDVLQSSSAAPQRGYWPIRKYHPPDNKFCVKLHHTSGKMQIAEFDVYLTVGEGSAVCLFTLDLDPSRSKMSDMSWPSSTRLGRRVAPASAARVGRTSSEETTSSEREYWEIWPGQYANAGIRMPPSQVEPLPVLR